MIMLIRSQGPHEVEPHPSTARDSERCDGGDRETAPGVPEAQEMAGQHEQAQHRQDNPDASISADGRRFRAF
jgi:hypothetical protein